MSEITLELLPPHPREECQECHKKFNTKRLHKNKRTGKLVCKPCDKRLGSNRWYIPLDIKERGRFARMAKIGKFQMSQQEQSILHRQYMAQGLGSEEAWKRVNRACGTLRFLKNRNHYNKRMEEANSQNVQKEASESNKKFLEGLK